MDNNLLVVPEAAVLLSAVFLAMKSYIDFLLFRSGLPGRHYRVGYWIQTDEAIAGPLRKAVDECLTQHGIEGVRLQDQAAADLYRNTRWRDRIGWHAGRMVDMVVVGRLREKATHDIGNPYAWVLDLRYFYPKNGAQLSARQLSTYVQVVAGAARPMATKATDEMITALWLMKSGPPPPEPRYPYDTSSWPFTQSLDLTVE